MKLVVGQRVWITNPNFRTYATRIVSTGRVWATVARTTFRIAIEERALERPGIHKIEGDRAGGSYAYTDDAYVAWQTNAQVSMASRRVAELLTRGWTANHVTVDQIKAICAILGIPDDIRTPESILGEGS